MIGIRILAAITAYCVILLEIYSGAIQGPWWWIAPGALVIALLFALSIFGLAQNDNGGGGSVIGGLIQWVLILGTATAMSGFANYFGRDLLPNLVDQAVLPAPAQIELPLSVPEDTPDSP